MTPVEIMALVETLRNCGVTHYKNGDVELELGPAPIKQDLEPANKEIIHKVVEMTSLLKLDDNSLVDRLWPDHRDVGGAEESAAEG